MSSLNPTATGGNAATLGGPIELSADQSAIFDPAAQRNLPPPMGLPESKPAPGTVRVTERFTVPEDRETGLPRPVERQQVKVPIDGGGTFTFNTEPNGAELRWPVLRNEHVELGGVFNASERPNVLVKPDNRVGLGLYGEVRIDPSFAMSWQYVETWALAGSDPTQSLVVSAAVKMGDVSVAPSVRFVDLPGKGIDRTEYSVTASATLDAETSIRASGSFIDRHGLPDGFAASVGVTRGNADVQFRVDRYNNVAGRDETAFQIRGSLRF